MLEQLRLAPASGQGPPVYLDVEIPDELVERIRGIGVGGRLALARHLPDTISGIVDAVLEERHRRGQCGECAVHQTRGHLLGCTQAAASTGGGS